MKAIILAAGKGTRFLPLTETTPKPLINVKNKPILERIIEELPDQIDEVVLITAHLEDKIIEYFGDFFCGKKIKYCSMKNEKEYGTAIAVFVAQNILEKNETFLVLNSDDLLSKDDLENIINIKNNFVFCVYKTIPENNKFVDIKYENDLLKSFDKIEEIREINIATGVYKLNSEIFKYKPYLLKNGEYSLPHTILDLSKNNPVEIYEMKKWIPINNFDELKKAEIILEK